MQARQACREAWSDLGEGAVGGLLRTRPRMFLRTKSTELMPSSLSLRDGLRSLMASEANVRGERTEG